MRKIRKSVELIMGPRKSGITHFIEQKAHKPFTSILSIDKIKDELYGGEWAWFSEHGAFKEMLKRLKQLLQKPAEHTDMIYVDFPFVTKVARDQVYKAIKASGVDTDTFLTLLNTPIDVCLARNRKSENPVSEKFIRRQFQKLQYPHELPASKVICMGSKNYRHYKDVEFPEDYKPIQLGGGGKHVVLDNRTKPIPPRIYTGSGSSPNDRIVRPDVVDTIIHHKTWPDEMVERVMRARAELWSQRQGGIFGWFKRHT